MHLIESYATSCGLKIDKPFISEKFFPLGEEKYITIHPYTKPAKTYDHWQEVIDIILPILKNNGISIVQVGAKDEKPLQGCVHTQGGTSFGDLAYLIRNSLLHFGADSCSAHFAGSYDKKMVSLYSSSYVEISKPYWGNPENQILIQAPLLGKKPSFSLEENPKTINRIKPSEIAKHIFNLLNIPFNFRLDYEHFGDLYNERSLELVPNSLISHYPINVDGIRIRMDYLFNEKVLVENLKLKNVSIVTNKEISSSIIDFFKDRIKQIVYIIEEDNNPEFIRNAIQKGISCALTSYLPEDKLNAHKINYMEYGIIAPQRIAKKEEFNFSSKPNLFYKSKRSILSAGNIYPSKAALESNSPSNTFDPTLNAVIDSPSFWEEAKYFAFLSKI